MDQPSISTKIVTVQMKIICTALGVRFLLDEM